ncbi:hypothetical protein, partial [Comamonas testosteroni]|uniref:hypothetical protein n=1 Tax=Comamonas testosteroni TaxID=285 RepID=UPI0005B36FFA
AVAAADIVHLQAFKPLKLWFGIALAGLGVAPHRRAAGLMTVVGKGVEYGLGDRHLDAVQHPGLPLGQRIG